MPWEYSVPNRIEIGGDSAAFVLADEAPQELYTPIIPDHPITSTIPNPSITPTSSTSLDIHIHANQRLAHPDEISEQISRPSNPPESATIPPNPRIRPRRRRRSPSSGTSGADVGAEPRRSRITEEERDSREDNPGSNLNSQREGPSSHKRQRLMSKDMRHDPETHTPASNGARYNGNGSTISPLQKSKLAASTNGHSYGPNGHSTNYTNGSTPVTAKLRRPSYYGHDREEVTRLIIQGLNDLGYRDAAARLIHESGYELECPSVAAFRHAVLEGEWAEAEGLLFGNSQSDSGGVSLNNGDSVHHQGLLLAEGANKDELKFQLRKQKYLELLEDRDLGAALMVLRQELTPLNQDIAQLHVLSSLIVCQSADDLKTQASWDGADGTSRSTLLSELSKSISPSVMIPDHRLAVLLDLVKQNQISQCLYHNPTTSPSLFSDHMCDRSQFPLQTVLELSNNEDQVWFLEFSHDGRRLATCGKDTVVVIYDMTTFRVDHLLTEHNESVAYAAWSPDDTKLITCSHDHKARVWDITTGRCILTIDHHVEPVTTASWAPNGETFLTGSLDKQSHLCLWSLSGRNLYTWSGDYRVLDCAISPDGQRLVTFSNEKQIFVYNFITREEEYSLRLKTKLTCINISRDSKYMLVNMDDGELQLIDIHSAEVVRRFLGQKQGEFVIRSSFGGADENLIISGSEDGRVYIWHKENGALIETLEGHAGGCVNDVAWNPADSCMFASAGDDKKVRIWSKETSPDLQKPGNGYHRTHGTSGTLI